MIFDKTKYLVKIIFSAACLLTSIASANCPGTGIRIGMIDDFLGSSENYIMKRDGQECTLQYYMYVYDGDQVTVRSSEGDVRIKYISGREQEVRSYSPVTLTGVNVGKRRGVIDAFVEEVRILFARSSSIIRSSASRGGGILALAPHSLTVEETQIAAGSRNFTVTWAGGKPPYRVTLSRSGSLRLLIDEPNIFGDQLVILTRKINLQSGDYQVNIIDALNVSVLGNFKTVRSKKIPSPPTDLVPDWYSDNAKMVIKAYWLARQENGKWAFEASIQLAAIARDYNPAKHAMQLIVWSRSKNGSITHSGTSDNHDKRH